MRTSFKTTKTLLAFLLINLIQICALAQTPPSPNDGENPGSSNISVGGSASINQDLSILFLVVSAYSIFRVCKSEKQVNS